MTAREIGIPAFAASRTRAYVRPSPDSSRAAGRTDSRDFSAALNTLPATRTFASPAVPYAIVPIDGRAFILDTPVGQPFAKAATDGGGIGFWRAEVGGQPDEATSRTKSSKSCLAIFRLSALFMISLSSGVDGKQPSRGNGEVQASHGGGGGCACGA